MSHQRSHTIKTAISRFLRKRTNIFRFFHGSTKRKLRPRKTEKVLFRQFFFRQRPLKAIHLKSRAANSSKRTAFSEKIITAFSRSFLKFISKTTVFFPKITPNFRRTAKTSDSLSIRRHGASVMTEFSSAILTRRDITIRSLFRSVTLRIPKLNSKNRIIKQGCDDLLAATHFSFILSFPKRGDRYEEDGAPCGKAVL